MLDEVKAKLETITGLFVSLLALSAAALKWRKAFFSLIELVRGRFGRWRRIDEAIWRIEASMDGLHEQTSKIGKAVHFLEEVHQVSFRNQPFPAFLCDEQGKNALVSESYQMLLGVPSDEDLESLNWHGFIHQDDLGEYLAAFSRSVNSESNFRHAVRFQRATEKQVGRWMVDARRMRDGSYIGRLIPDDDDARAICEDYGWTLK